MKSQLINIRDARKRKFQTHTIDSASIFPESEREKNMDIREGDLVMFVDEGTYAKWFFGRLAVVTNSTPERKSCRVKWLEPVLYHGKYTSVSDFGWDRFEVYHE